MKMIKKFEEDNFKWEKDPDYDYILSEGSNSSICLRKISWNDRDFKIDIRKYNYKDNKEIMGKGISLSDEAADSLAEVLVDTNYGDTATLLKSLRKREDFKDALANKASTVDGDDSDGEDYYDPSELLGEGEAIE
jgi:hypothetical protein